jgi:hypothetical protein
MDNRLNKVRKAMTLLRADMLRQAGEVRDQINRGHDCTDAAARLMAMRGEMTTLVREWKHLGGSVQLPTVEERLKERRGASRAVRRLVPRQISHATKQKRRLAHA